MLIIWHSHKNRNRKQKPFISGKKCSIQVQLTNSLYSLIKNCKIANATKNIRLGISYQDIKISISRDWRVGNFLIRCISSLAQRKMLMLKLKDKYLFLEAFLIYLPCV